MKVAEQLPAADYKYQGGQLPDQNKLPAAMCAKTRSRSNRLLVCGGRRGFHGRRDLSSHAATPPAAEATAVRAYARWTSSRSVSQI